MTDRLSNHHTSRQRLSTRYDDPVAGLEREVGDSDDANGCPSQGDGAIDAVTLFDLTGKQDNASAGDRQLVEEKNSKSR